MLKWIVRCQGEDSGGFRGSTGFSEIGGHAPEKDSD